ALGFTCGNGFRKADSHYRRPSLYFGAGGAEPNCDPRDGNARGSNLLRPSGVIVPFGQSSDALLFGLDRSVAVFPEQLQPSCSDAGSRTRLLVCGGAE